jgi:hypothetical protein
MGEPVLHVEALEAGYNEVQVLWGVSLAVAPMVPARRLVCALLPEISDHSAAGCGSRAKT